MFIDEDKNSSRRALADERALRRRNARDFAATCFPAICFPCDVALRKIYAGPVSSSRLTMTNASRDLSSTSSRASTSDPVRGCTRGGCTFACTSRPKVSHRDISISSASFRPSGDRDIRRRINDFESAVYATRSRRVRFRLAKRIKKCFRCSRNVGKSPAV